MSDGKELLAKINRVFAEKDTVYRDEPILMTASQMKNFTPPVIRDMRRIALHCYFNESAASVFCKQAEFMADFEDEYTGRSPFTAYFPDYQQMNDAQLRTYFTWRTRYRKGEAEPIPVSYLYVYAFELFNGIGGTSDEDRLHMLIKLWEDYRENTPHLSVYLPRWIRDYCIWYGVPVPDFDCGKEKAVYCLFDTENKPDEELFEAVRSLSSYDFSSYAGYKKEPEAFLRVTADAVRKIADCGKYDNDDNCFFGEKRSERYEIFRSAVFCPSAKHPDAEYELIPYEKYIFKDGFCNVIRYIPYVGSRQPAGSLMHTLDSLLRPHIPGLKPVKEGKLPKWVRDICVQCVEKYIWDREQKNKPHIQPDLGLLSGIRKDAGETREKLLTEEERDFGLRSEPKPEPETDRPETGTDSPLSVLEPMQREFIKAVANGRPWTETVKRSGKTVSVLTDEINEKLYDMVGDTVLEWTGTQPVLVEDYREDLQL